MSVVSLNNKQVYGNIMFKCLSNICHLVNSHTCTLSKKGLCSAFKTTLQWGLGFTYCFMHSQLLWSYSKEPWIHFCFRAFGSETGIYHLIIPVCVGINSNQHLLHKWLWFQSGAHDICHRCNFNQSFSRKTTLYKLTACLEKIIIIKWA